MNSSVRVGWIVTVVCGVTVACGEQPSSDRPIKARIVISRGRRENVFGMGGI